MFKTKTDVSGLFKNGINKKNYYFFYTFAFIVTAILVNFVFIRKNLTYVSEVDALTQHSVALEYYGQWLRDFLKTLFIEHRFEFRNFDFSIGMGTDVVKAFNYYAIGDPLNLLSVFVPVKYTAYLYTFIVFLRYYLSGVAFSAYCFERNHNNCYGVLTTSLVYVFSVFGVMAGTNHGFFINPMIYMPLIFIAVEKILKNRNPLYLAAIVCVAEISNFYFFYMLVFATIVYTCLRLYAIYGTQIQRMIVSLVKIAVSAVGGVLLGAFIFFPTILSFLSDGRVSAEHTYGLLYDFSYYRNFILSFVYPNPYSPWTLVGSTALFLYALVALFLRRKKDWGLKIAFLICIVGYCLPVFGGFTNGFSYACNRWGFIFTFVLAYISSHVWDDLFCAENTKKAIINISVPVVYVAACCVLPEVSSYRYKIALVVFAVFTVLLACSMLILKTEKFRKYFQVAMVALNIFCLTVNGYVLLNMRADRHLTQKQVNDTVSEEYLAVSGYAEKTGDNSFYRYTSDFLEYNDAIRRNGYSTQYYWSLSNSFISDFQDSVYINESFYQHYNGFDDSAVFNSMSSVKYYYDKEDHNGVVPFGFEPTDKENLYRNRYTLPVAYTYDSYITRDEFDALKTSAHKQQALMQGVVLEEEPSGVSHAQVRLNVETPEFEIIPDSKYVTIDNNTFTVTKRHATVTLRIKQPVSGEAYISLRNLDFISTHPSELFTDNTEVDPLNIYDEETLKKYDAATIDKHVGSLINYPEPEILKIYFRAFDNAGTENTKEIKYYTPFYRFYVGKSDYDVCLGHSEDGFTEIKMAFGAIGRYSLDNLKVVVQNMDYFTEGVVNLTENTLENVNISTDRINGTLSLEKSGLLCFAVPYSDGWIAYVDGERQPVLKANIMHTAIEVPQGTHEIELRYIPNEMRSGAVISILGFVLLFAYGMWYHIEKKKNHIVFIEVD